MHANTYASIPPGQGSSAGLVPGIDAEIVPFASSVGCNPEAGCPHVPILT